MAYEIVHYVTAVGRDVFSDWLDSQRKRIDVGTGYRVYYAIAGREIVLLLCGGDKRSQASDITKACEYRRDFLRRRDDEK